MRRIKKQSCEACGKTDCSGWKDGDPFHEYRGKGSWFLGCHCAGCTKARNESGGFIGALADHLNPAPAPNALGSEPVVWVSSKQLPHNPEHAYMACRLQPEGNFDTALYAVASADEESLWRFWNEKARKLAVGSATTKQALKLAGERLALLLQQYPADSEECDHPVATRYVLEQVRAALAASEGSADA